MTSSRPSNDEAARALGHTSEHSFPAKAAQGVLGKPGSATWRGQVSLLILALLQHVLSLLRLELVSLVPLHLMREALTLRT